MIIWDTVALLALIVGVVIVVRAVRRGSEDDLDFIHKQANCPHPYHYVAGGKKLCARCGKELPKSIRELI